MAKDYRLEKRKFVIGGIALSIVLIYLIRLFVLQITTDDYKKNADSNAFLNKIQYPSRGAIYDRTGKLLVFNQPAYDITIVPKEVENLDTLDLCQSLNITRAQFLKIMSDMKDRRRNPGYSRYTNQLFMSQLSAEECGVFQEKLFKFRGFYIQRRTIRQYSYDAAAHALGDIGEVSAKEMEADEEGYYIRGDYVGKLGVEKSYEKYLRGEKGIEILLRDAHGRIQGHYMDGEYDRPSVPGKNLTLSLDIDLQMLGERLLKNKIGSIVAIEPETGEILCLVSSPNYDPHLMIGRQRGKNHLMLQRDKMKPLLNRALMGVYPPGSTFKTITATAGLNEGIVAGSSTYFCGHSYEYKGHTYYCTGSHGNISVVQALQYSCNIYFYQLSEALTIDNLTKYAELYGLGSPTGIETGDAAGRFANPETYAEYGWEWTVGHVLQAAIGQSETAVTPLQMAVVASTIANKGVRYQPHLVDSLWDYNLTEKIKDIEPTVAETIPIQHDDVYTYIQQGMIAASVTNMPDKYSLADLGYDVAIKTGTPQAGGGRVQDSFFIGYAPADNPKIAFACVVEGAEYSKYMIRDVLKAYERMETRQKANMEKNTTSNP